MAPWNGRSKAVVERDMARFAMLGLSLWGMNWAISNQGRRAEARDLKGRCRGKDRKVLGTGQPDRSPSARRFGGVLYAHQGLGRSPGR